MNWMGETVPLKGWAKYNAGLDTGPTEATGKESLYTTFREYEIMFHVSTMLPYTDGDSQQLARKRHLGNDIVVILFQEVNKFTFSSVPYFLRVRILRLTHQECGPFSIMYSLLFPKIRKSLRKEMKLVIVLVLPTKMGSRNSCHISL